MGSVYKDTGIVYKDTGIVYKDTGIVYKDTGIVYKDAGIVFISCTNQLSIICLHVIYTAMCIIMTFS